MQGIQRIKKAMGLCLGLGLCAGVHAAPASDLETPATPSALAASYLLLDVDEAGSRLVAVGARGHIVYSDDQGKNWTQAQVPVSVMLTGVDFVNAKEGWAVGHAGVILHSTDGGATWEKQFDGNAANEFVIQGAQEKVARLEDELAAATEALEAAEASGDAAALEAAQAVDIGDLEYVLEDAQFGLEDAEADAEAGAAKPLLDVLFLDENRGFASGAFGFFFGTTDGGKTWDYLAPKLENPNRFHLNALARIDDNTVFVVGEAGQIFRSTDAGETWDMLDSPYEGSFFGVGRSGEPGGVLVYGLRGNAFKSNDLGDTWEHLSLGITETLMASGLGESGRVSLVGNGGMLVLSRDGGQTYSTHPREDRKALLGVQYLSADRLLLVGEDGVSIIREVSRLN